MKTKIKFAISMGYISSVILGGTTLLSYFLHPPIIAHHALLGIVGLVILAYGPIMIWVHFTKKGR